MDVRWCKIMNDLMIYPGAKWEVDNFNLRLPQQTWWCSTSPIGNHASMFRFHPDEFNGWKRHIIWHWWIGFCRVTVANSHRISGQGFIWFICHWLFAGTSSLRKATRLILNDHSSLYTPNETTGCICVWIEIWGVCIFWPPTPTP